MNDIFSKLLKNGGICVIVGKYNTQKRSWVTRRVCMLRWTEQCLRYIHLQRNWLLNSNKWRVFCLGLWEITQHFYTISISRKCYWLLIFLSGHSRLELFTRLHQSIFNTNSFKSHVKSHLSVVSINLNELAGWNNWIHGNNIEYNQPAISIQKLACLNIVY